jgi:uncharacterized protein (UPF0147 family)
MSTVSSSGLYAPYSVVESLHSIILRQRLEAQTLRHEIAQLQQRIRDDQGVPQFARSQQEEYADFLRGPLQEIEVKCEVARLGELEDDEEDGENKATMAIVVKAAAKSVEAA